MEEEKHETGERNRYKNATIRKVTNLKEIDVGSNEII